MEWPLVVRIASGKGIKRIPLYLNYYPHCTFSCVQLVFMWIAPKLLIVIIKLFQSWNAVFPYLSRGFTKISFLMCVHKFLFLSNGIFLYRTSTMRFEIFKVFPSSISINFLLPVQKNIISLFQSFKRLPVPPKTILLFLTFSKHGINNNNNNNKNRLLFQQKNLLLE